MTLPNAAVNLTDEDWLLVEQALHTLMADKSSYFSTIGNMPPAEAERAQAQRDHIISVTAKVEARR